MARFIFHTEQKDFKDVGLADYAYHIGCMEHTVFQLPFRGQFVSARNQCGRIDDLFAIQGVGRRKTCPCTSLNIA